MCVCIICMILDSYKSRKILENFKNIVKQKYKKKTKEKEITYKCNIVDVVREFKIFFSATHGRFTKRVLFGKVCLVSVLRVYNII